MISLKSALKSMLSLVVVCCSATGAQAQNVQNFLNNEENRIQQDTATGAINSKQASAIQNQQAGIMYQEQQYKNQNGGNLTPQQAQQIAGEERQLKNNVNQTVYGNGSNSNSGGLFSRLKNGFGGLNQNNQNNLNYNPNNLNWAQQQQLQMQQQQMLRANWAQNQNGYNPNNQSNFNYGQGYHHHHQWNNNNPQQYNQQQYNPQQYNP